ncbi:MAG: PAS domain S-box protein, partial [Deltaproteobacteria bacterium]|nr:PAS domain S-box protein [Deltaproteobacteria bacterium]
PETRKFIYVNTAICKLLGYAEDELTQMGVIDLHPKES